MEVFSSFLRGITAELLYGKSNFEQGGIIVASNNQLTHEKVCLEIKEIIKRSNLYPL